VLHKVIRSIEFPRCTAYLKAPTEYPDHYGQWFRGLEPLGVDIEVEAILGSFGSVSNGVPLHRLLPGIGAIPDALPRARWLGCAKTQLTHGRLGKGNALEGVVGFAIVECPALLTLQLAIFGGQLLGLTRAQLVLNHLMANNPEREEQS